jgi:hypothetical protein
MNDNPLVTEIRKKRAEILATYHGDYLAMMNAMKQNQWTSGHEVVHLARETSPTTPPAQPTRRKTANLAKQ